MPGLWVQLDREVLEALRRHRRGRGEDLNELLRRVLNLDRLPGPAEPGFDRWGKPWRRGPVMVPHGTEIRMTHGGRSWYGTVAQGEWLVGRGRFPGPEGAAVSIFGQGDADIARPDPWIAWNLRLPGRRRWVPLISLRDPSQ